MRHKYETLGLVLARSHIGEANTSIIFLNPDLGLVHARAQGLRNTGAKLASSLATLTESRVVLVRGKEGWRVTGAVLEENWFARLPEAAPRERLARVTGLLLRLVAGETQDSELFPVVKAFFVALATLPEDRHEAVEILAVLRILASLGFDTGEIPEDTALFSAFSFAEIIENRAGYIARINNGIAASEL